jgi:hypothetical protein
MRGMDSVLGRTEEKKGERVRKDRREELEEVILCEEVSREEAIACWDGSKRRSGNMSCRINKRKDRGEYWRVRLPGNTTESLWRSWRCASLFYTWELKFAMRRGPQYMNNNNKNIEGEKKKQ